MTTLTGSSGTVEFGTGYPTVIGGTLINAVEHKVLARSLVSGDYDAVRRLAENSRLKGSGSWRYWFPARNWTKRMYCRKHAWLHTMHQGCRFTLIPPVSVLSAGRWKYSPSNQSFL